MAEQTNSTEQHKAELLEQVANGDISTGKKVGNIAGGLGVGAVTGVGTFFGGVAIAKSQTQKLATKVAESVGKVGGEVTDEINKLYNLENVKFSEEDISKIGQMIEGINLEDALKSQEKAIEAGSGLWAKLTEEFGEKFEGVVPDIKKIVETSKEQISTVVSKVKTFAKGNAALAVGMVAIPTAVAVASAAYFNKKSRDKVRANAKEELTQLLNAEEVGNHQVKVELLGQLQQTQEQLDHAHKQMAEIQKLTAVQNTPDHKEGHDAKHHDGKAADHFQNMVAGAKPEHTTHVDGVGGPKTQGMGHAEQIAHQQTHHEHASVNAL